MPIYPLPVLSEEEEQNAIEKLQPPKDVVVRYGYLRQIAEFPYEGDQVLGCGTKLVIRTQRGVEIGEMLTTTCPNSGCGKSVSRKQMLEFIENSGGKQYPFSTEGKVLRVATVEDLNDQSRLDREKPRYAKAAKARVAELKLSMKIVDVEPLFSRDKIVFYFTAENRVDFRQLVRELAKEMHVRVEMRQVGARDEARLVADYEKCGQHCCCRQFLKVLKPVSMRSAKVQKATLDPSKISGRCGRLMCCLRYEDETYEDLRRRLPHRKTRVRTEDGDGTVISTQILTQLVLIELDRDKTRLAYPLENIEMLNGKDAKIQPPTPSRDQSTHLEPPRPKPGKPLGESEVESREGKSGGKVDPSDDSSQSHGRSGKKRRKKRRRKGKGKGPGRGPSSGPKN